MRCSLSHKEVRSLFQKGARMPGGWFTLFYTPAVHGNGRIAVSVTKRHSAHAVDRNRTRRRLRACVRDMTPTYDCVLHITGRCKESPQVMCSTVRSVLKRGGVL